MTFALDGAGPWLRGEEDAMIVDLLMILCATGLMIAVMTWWQGWVRDEGPRGPRMNRLASERGWLNLIRLKRKEIKWLCEVGKSGKPVFS